MSLQDELREIELEIRDNTKNIAEKVLLFHSKAHMFHNQRMHEKAVLEMQKLGIEHKKFDNLDNTYK